MKIVFCALFLGIFFSAVSFGQKPVIAEKDLAQLKEWEDTIALLSFAIVNDSFPENRFGATKKLIPTLVQALKTPNSFQYPFGRVQSISIQYPEDSTFRIFTWQLYVDANEYRYYGAIQMNSGELQLYPLVDRSYEIQDVENQILPPDKWYGALYYGIKPFETAEGMKYLLFGYDAFSLFNKRKVIEVLSFPEGKPQFGSPVFYTSEGETGLMVRNRLLFEYAAEASVKCNFDPVLEIIVVDHLVDAGELYEGQGPSQIPDGSYEGFLLSEGVWKHISMLENQIMDEPPRPFPILDGDEDLDILGRKKQ